MAKHSPPVSGHSCSHAGTTALLQPGLIDGSRFVQSEFCPHNPVGQRAAPFRVPQQGKELHHHLTALYLFASPASTQQEKLSPFD